MRRLPIPQVWTRHGSDPHPDHRLLAIALEDAVTMVIGKDDRGAAFDEDGDLIAGGLTPWDFEVCFGWGGDEDLAAAVFTTIGGVS